MRAFGEVFLLGAHGSPTKEAPILHVHSSNVPLWLLHPLETDQPRSPLKVWDIIPCGCQLCPEEFLLEMHILRECRFDGILYAVGLTFTQPVCWGEGFKWCAGKCPLNTLIIFPSFLFHFKPYSGNCLWFKGEISDLPANTSLRSSNLHFTHKNHFSQLRCLSKHQCVNQGKVEMQRM